MTIAAHKTRIHRLRELILFASKNTNVDVSLLHTSFTLDAAPQGNVVIDMTTLEYEIQTLKPKEFDFSHVEDAYAKVSVVVNTLLREVAMDRIKRRQLTNEIDLIQSEMLGVQSQNKNSKVLSQEELFEFARTIELNMSHLSGAFQNDHRRLIDDNYATVEQIQETGKQLRADCNKFITDIQAFRDKSEAYFNTLI